MAVEVRDIELTQGAAPQPIHFEFNNGSGGDLDLTGYTLYAQVRPSRYSRNIMATPALAFEGAASEGRVEMQFSAEESNKLFGTPLYEIWAVHPTLGELSLVEGTITVKGRIYRPAA